MGVEIHHGTWPIMVMCAYDELTTGDVEAMKRGFARAFERGGPFVTWMDGREVNKVPTPATRRAIAEWMRSIESQMREHNVGSCNLVGSPILRGVVTAIFWIYTPPVPQGVPNSIDEAKRWCAARLREAGEVPDDALEALDEYLDPRLMGNW